MLTTLYAQEKCGYLTPVSQLPRMSIAEEIEVINFKFLNEIYQKLTLTGVILMKKISHNSASTVTWLGFCNIATVIWSNCVKAFTSKGAQNEGH